MANGGGWRAPDKNLIPWKEKSSALQMLKVCKSEDQQSGRLKGV